MTFEPSIHTLTGQWTHKGYEMRWGAEVLVLPQAVALRLASHIKGDQLTDAAKAAVAVETARTQ